MKYSKYILLTLITIMAASTFVEKFYGTAFAYNYFYASWWFAALWAILAIGAIFSIAQGKKYRNIPLCLLHISLLLILAGALCTKLWGEQGLVILQKGKPNITENIELPFAIALDTFRIEYYAGTNYPSDYISEIHIDGEKAQISMNKILTCKGYRFCQSSFGADATMSVLSVNRDATGIPITYAGYALFVLSMMWIGIGKGRKLMLGMAFLLLPTLSFANVGEQQAADFGRLSMLYNGRIAPVSAFAHDFTLKLNGKATVGNYCAEEVLIGFLFFPEKWEVAPPSPGASKKEIAKWNNKTHLINLLHIGEPLKIFPLKQNKKIQWYSPTDHLPAEVSAGDSLFVRSILSEYYLALHNDDTAKCADIIQKIRVFQEMNAAEVLPSGKKVKTEQFCLKHDLVSLLFKINLTAGVFCLFLISFLRNRKWLSIANKLFFVQLILSFTLLSLFIALRSYIGGRLPLFANGLETMLLLALLTMLGGVVFYRKMPLLLPFAYLISGCALLVAHLNRMNPSMTPLVPVLSSPLLSFHVSSMMISYSLLAFTALNSLIASIQFLWAKDMSSIQRAKQQNLPCIFSAVFFLGTGIFIGAVWANISWGRYWGWDPKETWALITFLLYGMLLHRQFAPKNPIRFHIVCLLDFFSVLMTYFGVNYFLGGMHAY